jgi:alpha-beta hydrolase superfamily lysophospholipase
MVEALLGAGFAVCAIDLAGHGASRRVLDLRAALEDVRASVAWLRPRAAWIGIAGISLGGCVAARAVADGLAVDGLAILEAPASVAVTRRVVRNEWRTIARHGTWALHRYAGTLPLIRAWRTEPTRSRISTVDLIRDLNLLQSVGQVRCPVWLCYGAADLVATPDDARRIAAAAQARTVLRIIPRATHLSLPLDRRALQALCRWLRDVRVS